MANQVYKYRVTVIEPEEESDEAVAAALALAGVGLITMAAVVGVALVVHTAASAGEVSDIAGTKPIFD